MTYYQSCAKCWFNVIKLKKIVSDFVISTQDKPHNVSNLCDFSRWSK